MKIYSLQKFECFVLAGQTLNGEPPGKTIVIVLSPVKTGSQNSPWWIKTKSFLPQGSFLILAQTEAPKQVINKNGRQTSLNFTMMITNKTFFFSIGV